VGIPQRQVGSTLEGAHNFSPLRFRGVNANRSACVLQSADHVVEELLVCRLSGPIRGLLFNIEPNGAVEVGVLKIGQQLIGLRNTRGSLRPWEHVNVNRVHASVVGVVYVGGAVGVPGARTSPGSNDGVVIPRVDEAAKAALGARIGQIDAFAVPCPCCTRTGTIAISTVVRHTALNVTTSRALACDIAATVAIHL